MPRISVIYSLIIFLGSSLLNAQSWDELFNKYLQGELDSLMVPNLSVADENNPFYITLRALFEEDGEKALNMYRRALNQSVDSTLRQFLVDKIYDYYYSRGLYITARKFESSVKKKQAEIASVNQPGEEAGVEEGVFLQYGVFSTEANARNFIAKNKNFGIKLRIFKKGKHYYVITGPYFDEKEAQSEKKKIHQKTSLRPFVKKF